MFAPGPFFMPGFGVSWPWAGIPKLSRCTPEPLLRKGSTLLTSRRFRPILEGMKMSTDLEKKFQDQITLEFEASITYRQLAIEADEQDLPGIAAWLRHQADEEIVHANKFIDHLSDRGNHAEIGQISAPSVTTGLSVLEIFQAALAHEEKVSNSIRDLYREADAEGDFDSRPLLNWFVDEQIEEEATASEIIGRLKLINGEGSGLLRLDAELGQRPEEGTED